MLKIFRRSVFLPTVLLGIFIGQIQSLAVPPNLDDDSQPNRTQLKDCLADVRQSVGGWSEEEIATAANQICNARKAHAKAKAKFIADLAKLHQQYVEITNHGFSQHLNDATNDAWNTVKSCIDFKEGFTYPHNVAIFIVPNDVRSSCYGLGSQLVESQLQR